MHYKNTAINANLKSPAGRAVCHHQNCFIFHVCLLWQQHGATQLKLMEVINLINIANIVVFRDKSHLLRKSSFRPSYAKK
jgi:hypothetical protein